MSQSEATVLFISHDASRTGAPLFLLRYLRWLRESGQVSFRTLVGKAGELVPDLAVLGEVDLFEPEPTIAYRLLRRLRMNAGRRRAHLELVKKRLMDSNIRLIYANTIVNGRILNFLEFLACPVICHVHELEEPIRDSGPQNMAFVRKYASSYIAVSEAVKRNLVENHEIAAEKIEVIHGFIPTAIAVDENASSSVRLELGIPAESRLVCACGSIEPRKGTDLFLEVARTVARNHANPLVHFLWVGGRPELVSQMRTQVKESALRGRVHFVGPKANVAHYYQASDIFLLTSREDPFPLVMMEAALQGKPIVCFAGSGGAPEFVGESAGFVVPELDVEEMASRVILLLSTEGLRRGLGAAARQKVLSNHDLAVVAPQIAAVLHNSLKHQ